MIRKILILLFTMGIVMTACGGPQYPFDTGYQDSADLAQEFEEGRREAELYDYTLEMKWGKLADEERRKDEEYERGREFDALADEEQGYTSSSGEGCPNGCTTHKSGRDIKGNISFDKHEKIYHVPGQNFYNETKISPEYGERWFCTEAEARANGWRNAKN